MKRKAFGRCGPCFCKNIPSVAALCIRFLFHLLSPQMLLSECFSIFLLLFRLVLNPFFGVLLDKNGARKKKWLWHNLKEHVHAPPFQPITFMITKQLSIRCLSQVSRDFKCFLSNEDHTRF